MNLQLHSLHVLQCNVCFIYVVSNPWLTTIIAKPRFFYVSFGFSPRYVEINLQSRSSYWQRASTNSCSSVLSICCQSGGYFSRKVTFGTREFFVGINSAEAEPMTTWERTSIYVWMPESIFEVLKIIFITFLTYEHQKICNWSISYSCKMRINMKNRS